MTIKAGKPRCTGLLLAGLLASAGTAGAQARSHASLKRDSATGFEARTKLGIRYGREKEFDKALEEFHAVLSINPGFQPALIGMARVLSWQGRFNESLSFYDRVLHRDPANEEAASGKAFALLWAGRAQEAKSLFTLLLHRYPNDSELASGLENAQETLIEKARVPVATERAKGVVRDEKYFRDRLDQNPQDAPALKALTEFASTPQRCSERD